MGDGSHVILEKSRTVRRRYQRRKQQVQFSKAELERLERSDERERRAKKLQQQEKRRVANKKKRLEKEALAREERKRSGLPDPNANISSSQHLLSNFFGAKGGRAGNVRDKSESTGEDGGDTEVDSGDGRGSSKSTSPGETLDCSETGGIETDDSFDDDDALTLFNDENVLKEINGSGTTNEVLEPPTRRRIESMPASDRISPCENGSKAHSPSSQGSRADKKQVADQLASTPAVDDDGAKEKHSSTTGVEHSSKAKAEIGENDAFEDDLEEIPHSGSACVTSKSYVTPGTTPLSQESTACPYQEAEDVLAGLCAQDFDDDEVAEGSNKVPSPQSKLNGQQQTPCDKQPLEPTRPPLSNLAPTSRNTKKVKSTKTPQKQIDTSMTTPQPQTTTTTIIKDEYGSFSFDDDDLLSLGL